MKGLINNALLNTMVRYVHETNFLESFDNIARDCQAVILRAGPKLPKIDDWDPELLIGLLKTIQQDKAVSLVKTTDRKTRYGSQIPRAILLEPRRRVCAGSARPARPRNPQNFEVHGHFLVSQMRKFGQGSPSTRESESGRREALYISRAKQLTTMPSTAASLASLVQSIDATSRDDANRRRELIEDCEAILKRCTSIYTYKCWPAYNS